MGKLLKTLDDNILKIGVAFLTFFVALYPKLPSVHINHTWVYIRLEDFSIAVVVLIWLIQLLRRKANLPGIFAIPIIAYWIFGFLSLILSLILIAPGLLNFFPSIAILSYLRRIEYIILFFVAYSSIKSIKDLRDYVVILGVTVLGFTLYGLGQRYYLDLWKLFPAFFEKYQFCFPSFQTGNEEFAKGIPLCLPSTGRITSTFAGHYDLGAYLVFVIPIFMAVIFTIRKMLWKILFSVLTLASIILLILTASRISFLAYVVGGVSMLIFYNKKRFLLPFLLLSLVLLMLFSASTARRFLQTFRLASVVTNSQGQVVGESELGLSDELRAKLAKDKVILGNIGNQDLPQGSGFIGLPQTKSPQKTNVAVIKSNLSEDEARRLKLENGGVEIATVSGNFLVQQALVYDISFTTRFQAEWPNAIRALSKDPLLGSGYATITLATDNDYLRFLGESGALGLFSFLSIFLLFFITIRRVLPDMNSGVVRAVSVGFMSGLIALLVNALLIDVFEASKVAETLWLVSGVVMAGVMLQKKTSINYKKEITRLLTSNAFLLFYLLIIAIIVFGKSFSNFLVADDFTWAKWAATSTLSSLGRNFVDAQGFFYRPIDKFLAFFLYTVFALKPVGYHFFSLSVHFLITIGLYLIGLRLFSKRILALVFALIFLLLPAHAENVFWFSTISANVSTLLIVFASFFFILFRQKNSLTSYVLSVIMVLLALFTYEMAAISFLIIILIDIYLGKAKLNLKTALIYLPFLLSTAFYFVLRSISHAAASEGSYAYSIPHLIPNIVGNFIGYLSLSIFGESALPIYNQARVSLKAESFIVLVFALLATALLIGIVFLTRDRLRSLYKEAKTRLFIFGFLFATIALLPVLGFGNISGRYDYLASVGFAICFTLIIDQLAIWISRGVKKEKAYKYLVLFMVFLLSVFYVRGLNHSNYEWATAGKITNRSLAFLKIYHEDLPDNASLYFVNTPIKFQDAWVFPLGLNDGIWFIYRDDSVKVYNESSIEGARLLKRANKKYKSFIFYFDKNNKMRETK